MTPAFTLRDVAASRRSNPGTSVILVFRDAEPFLEAAILGVFAQTLDDWELLLVDDGSTDGSSEIAVDYAVLDRDRVRYLEHPGHAACGVGACRNLALAHARGTFLAFPNTARAWGPQWLQRRVSVLRRHEDAGFVCTGMSAAAARGARPRDGRSLLLDLLEDDDPMPALSTTLVRRRVIDRVGAFEPIDDEIFFATLCLHATACVLDEAADERNLVGHAGRRDEREVLDGDSDGGEWAGSESARRLDSRRERFLLWLDDYLRAHALDDERLRQVVDRELARQGESWIQAFTRTPVFPYVKRAVRFGLPPAAYSRLRQRVMERLARR
jgi:glycosyltransferase involved in cell wall biosynthesis